MGKSVTIGDTGKQYYESLSLVCDNNFGLLLYLVKRELFIQMNNIDKSMKPLH